jgi:simple sugar transport system ATP-binding protein
MVGRPIAFERPPAEQHTGEVRLAIHGVSAVDDRKRLLLNNVTLDVCFGEIVGLAGVSGNGQRPLAEAIAGLRPIESGAILLEGSDISNLDAAARINAGIGYIPEERMVDGVVKDFSVSDNVILRDLDSPTVSRRSFLRFAQIAERANTLVTQFNVKTPSIDTPVRNLSGGNIQKLVLARELELKPRMLIAAQPTRGVDVGASEYIHAQLVKQRATGTAILLISEDLDEILLLSDRIAVMYEGRIMDVMDRKDATPEKLGLLMAGVEPT